MAIPSSDFLFEIGVEELPHGFVADAEAQLRRRLESFFQTQALPFTDVRTFATPRRLAVRFRNVSAGTEAATTVKKGPLLSAAFAGGKLNSAGRGFLKTLGEEVLDRVTEAGLPGLPDHPEPGAYARQDGAQRFLILVTRAEARSTPDLLATGLPEILGAMEFPKTMRWGSSETSFARPVRWILSLYGELVIPFTFAGVASGRLTYGHSQLFPRSEAVSVASPADYEKTLLARKVLADAAERRASLEGQIRALEKTHGIRVLNQDEVLPLVTHLTEWPRAVLCTFDESFLALPREVLIREMVEHQKYFPVESDAGAFLNRFVVTSNIERDDFVQKGNLKVLTARLRDGSFLWEEDRKEGLVPMGEKLKAVTYVSGLGTVHDKVERTARIARRLAETTRRADAERAERLCRLMKNDLSSRMVYEFPALQGVMAEHYAVAMGLPADDAAALREHYLPLGAGGDLPRTDAGVVLAAAEKIENMMGHFALGHVPTGSADPYALRRNALGLLRLLIETPLDLSLAMTLRDAAPLYAEARRTAGKFATDEDLVKAVAEFIHARFKHYVKEKGASWEDSETLAAAPDRHADHWARLEALGEFRKDTAGDEYLALVKRLRNITEGGAASAYRADLFSVPEEGALENAFLNAAPRIRRAKETGNHGDALRAALDLKEPLARYFEKVTVVADDAALRANRISFLLAVLRAAEDF